MERLLATLRALRAPAGCPWDRQQTHESLRPHLLEEAAEATDALASGDDAQAAEELGDVLLQVAFHAVIAEEEGRYDYDAIESAITEKLVRRHPHVFGEEVAADAQAVEATWARVKAAERAERGEGTPDAAASVPASLPALARAAALGEALGWSPDDPRLSRALGAAAGDGDTDRRSLGEALLALALRVAASGADPEILLRDTLMRLAAEETA